MVNHYKLVSIAILTSISTASLANDWEVGTRVWLSEGETEWSHCASTACGGGSGTITISGTNYTYYGGDPTSKLNYSDTKATVIEVFANYKADNLTTMAKIGTGSGDGGTFRDQDWLTIAGVYNNLEFSDTLSETNNTDINYWMVDFGYPMELTYETNTTKQNYQITPFIGYFNYDEKLNAYGLTPVSDGDLNLTTTTLPNTTKVISNDINWSGLRIGVDVKTRIDNQFKLNANIAYALVDAENKDSHLLRTSSSDLGPAPNIISKGDGDGIMMDLLLNYTHDSNLDFEIGYRYWDLDADSGTTTFGPNFSTAFPSRSLYSIRSGLLIGAKYSF